MGLLDKLSGWLGRGRAELTLLVLGLDNSGKSSLLNALRPPEQRLPHLPPTVAPQQDHFQSTQSIVPPLLHRIDLTHLVTRECVENGTPGGLLILLISFLKI